MILTREVSLVRLAEIGLHTVGIIGLQSRSTFKHVDLPAIVGIYDGSDVRDLENEKVIYTDDELIEYYDKLVRCYGTNDDIIAISVPNVETIRVTIKRNSVFVDDDRELTQELYNSLVRIVTNVRDEYLGDIDEVRLEVFPDRYDTELIIAGVD